MTNLTEEQIIMVFKTCPEPSFTFLKDVLTNGDKEVKANFKSVVVVVAITAFLAASARRITKRVLSHTDHTCEGIVSLLSDNEMLIPTETETEQLVPLYRMIVRENNEELEESVISLTVTVLRIALDFWRDEFLKLACENEVVN